MRHTKHTPMLLVIIALFSCNTNAVEPQYASEGIAIPAATADEPLIDQFSTKKALEYLEQGTTAWQAKRKCVACRTNGTYIQLRPALTPILGKPNAANHEFLVNEITKFKRAPTTSLLQGIKPTQIAYMAQGMAEWDLHVNGKLTADTIAALDLMLSVQSDDGSWGNIDCWPPFESSSYQGATVAALALGTAPGFLEEMNADQQTQVAKLKKILANSTRAARLWQSTTSVG